MGFVHLDLCLYPSKASFSPASQHQEGGRSSAPHCTELAQEYKIHGLLADSLWALPDCQDLLLQGLVHHPASQSLAWKAWLNSWGAGAYQIWSCICYWKLENRIPTKSVITPERPTLHGAKLGNSTPRSTLWDKSRLSSCWVWTSIWS